MVNPFRVRPSSILRGHWTKAGLIAEDANGLSVPANDSSACKWCMVGACFAATDPSDPVKCGLVTQFIHSLARQVGAKKGRASFALGPWQDRPERTEQEVLDELIEAENKLVWSDAA